MSDQTLLIIKPVSRGFKLVCPSCNRESTETLTEAEVNLLTERRDHSLCFRCDPTADEPVPLRLSTATG